MTINQWVVHFYSYGANCYGNGVDKLSRVRKIKWVSDNHNNIMDLNNGILTSKAKNKYLFIAFALEYQKIQTAITSEKAGFVYTQLPIQLDATCNGYQHLSMLCRDSDLGKNLNVSSQGGRDETPQDFYGLLINKITQELHEQIKAGPNASSNKDP